MVSILSDDKDWDGYVIGWPPDTGSGYRESHNGLRAGQKDSLLFAHPSYNHLI